jgi:hypothetical protein
MTSDDRFSYTEVAVESKFVLSRFTYCHQVEGQLVLESPLSRSQVLLIDWQGAALFGQLAKPHSCHDLVAKVPGISLETAKQFVSLLLGAQMLCDPKSGCQNHFSLTPPPAPLSRGRGEGGEGWIGGYESRISYEVKEDGTIPEQANVTLAQWEFHDLLFHTRSRLGRHTNPSGGTYVRFTQIVTSRNSKRSFYNCKRMYCLCCIS